MSKNIKVVDEVYDRLSNLATRNGLSLGKQIDALIEGIYGATQPYNTNSVPTNPEQSDIEEELKKIRSKTDILKDIDAVKAIMKEEVDWCQDAETKRKIELKYGDKITKLWEEYNGTV